VPGAGRLFKEEETTYQLMRNGIKVVEGCYYGRRSSWMTDIMYGLRGHHEPQEEKVFREILKTISANASMLELGSYWACYSLWFAQRIPGAKVYMIEPVREFLEVGKRNFELNDMEGNFFHAYVGTEPRLLRDLDAFGDVLVQPRRHSCRMRRILRRSGYDIIAEHIPEESYSGDDLIVGKRRGVEGPEKIAIEANSNR
jgi:hypothetical protein